MKLVVDTNRIIAAVIRDGIFRKIITHSEIEFITVGFSKREVEKHKDEILKKAGITEKDLELVLKRLSDKLVILDDLIIKSYLKKAEEIMIDIDKDDVVFIAAALATKAVIWSDDVHFKKQNRIKVITTKELVEKLGF
jgi:predicted nucleic acid-binding protein